MAPVTHAWMSFVLVDYREICHVLSEVDMFYLFSFTSAPFQCLACSLPRYPHGLASYDLFGRIISRLGITVVNTGSKTSARTVATRRKCDVIYAHARQF